MERDSARDSFPPIPARPTPDQTGANAVKTDLAPVTEPEQGGAVSKTLKGQGGEGRGGNATQPRELRVDAGDSGGGRDSAFDSAVALGEEYERAEIVPIPAKCPRCKRVFVGRDAIAAPSLDNACCFYCGPNRSTRLIPHPDYPVVDAKTRRHGLFAALRRQDAGEGTHP
jgi:hypothetical protein